MTNVIQESGARSLDILKPAIQVAQRAGVPFASEIGSPGSMHHFRGVPLVGVDAPADFHLHPTGGG